MRCPSCGEENAADQKKCVRCGAELVSDSNITTPPVPIAAATSTPPDPSAVHPTPTDTTTEGELPASLLAASYQATPQVAPVTSSQSAPATTFDAEQDRIINSGSWGATLGIFYAAGMGAWGWFAGLFVAALIYPLYMVLWIIFIVNGKSIAWKTRKWQSFEQFLAVQKAWDLWGKILFVIQLLIIPAILAVMVLVAVNGARTKARDSEVKNDLRSLKTAVVQYSIDHEDKYPSSLKSLSPKYIKEVPTNPKSGAPYGYKATASSCILSSPLENASDMDLSSDADPSNGETYDLSCSLTD